MIRRPPRSTRVRSSAASDVYKRQPLDRTCRHSMASYLPVPFRVRPRTRRRLPARATPQVEQARCARCSAHPIQQWLRLRLHSSAGAIVVPQRIVRAAKTAANRSGPVHPPLRGSKRPAKFRDAAPVATSAAYGVNECTSLPRCQDVSLKSAPNGSVLAIDLGPIAKPRAKRVVARACQS